MEQNNSYTLSGMLAETNLIKNFETHFQKHLASMKCSINAKPRATTTTDGCLTRLGISESTFLSGNFELVPFTTSEYFYVLLYSFLCISVGSYTRGRLQWPHGLRCRSAAARLLRLWVRIAPGVWMTVCCDCCVLLGRGLCEGLITCPEGFYRLWCIAERDLETS